MGGNYGRVGEMTENQKREKVERLLHTHGPAHVRIEPFGSAPVFISIIVTAQTYHETKSKIHPLHLRHAVPFLQMCYI